jgi:hypothetical protein
MRARSLYLFLLRLHPAPFRDKFEDQMLWIFDESVETRGAASLLLDAFLSLVRQWLLRPGSWRQTPPSISIDGSTALSEQLHRKAETWHRRAWRLNALWLICGIAVYFLIPLSSHWNPIVMIWFISAGASYFNNRQGKRRPEEGTLSIGSWSDMQTMHRQQLEGKRDGLRTWNGTLSVKSIQLFGGGILVLLVVLHVALFARLYHRPYLNIDHARIWESSAGVILLTLYWLFMKRCNKRAERAIQQEIDAMDELPTSRPV